MKKVSILLFCLAVTSLHGELVNRIYPISKEAVELIKDSYPVPENEEKENSNNQLVEIIDIDPPSHIFFRKYGIELGEDGSSLAYDGQSLLITETEENHKKIRLILGVVEDIVRALNNREKKL